MSVSGLSANTAPFVHLSTHPQPTSLNFPSSSSNQNLPINGNSDITANHNLTVTWTSSIARHCKNGHLAKAAAEFTRMRIAGVEPNHITFVTLLSGCAHFPSQTQTQNQIPQLCFGASLHACVRKLRLDKDDVMVGTALVDMYSKCGRVDLARLSFDEICVKNKVSWNTMIDGYMRNGRIEDALMLFDEMPDRERDAISWTALINGFVKKGHFEHALECFQEMQLSGLEPDYVSIIPVLSACANLGTLGLGLWMNRFVMKQHFRENIRVNNSLIDMYSRCGCIEFARQVFERMPRRSLVSWNSIIVGLAINGHAEEALEFFNSMQKEGFEPDGISFTGALTACSHAGLVDDGLQVFTNMKSAVCRIEHYGCIVDLYSRAGRLEDALNFIENMPMKPNEVVLGSLLAACKSHGNVNLAERLVNYMAELDPDGDSNYVLLSNLYATVGNWHEASNVRMNMKARGIKKKPGISSIEVDCVIHEFVAGDKSHMETENIDAMLEHLLLELKKSGYIPETNVEESYEYD